MNYHVFFNQAKEGSILEGPNGLRRLILKNDRGDITYRCLNGKRAGTEHTCWQMTLMDWAKRVVPEQETHNEPEQT